jgi:hypothetical protein
VDASTWTRAVAVSTGDLATDVLPAGYDEGDAAADASSLARLRDGTVPWRTKRRIRHQVGDENELAARLTAWAAMVPPAPPTPDDPVRLLPPDAVGEALAREYRDVCGQLYGADDPEVVANARRIAAGDVAPSTARRAIAAERRRLHARAE